MPSKTGHKISLLAGLILTATGAVIWTDILLLSQNTLLYNGNWISGKRMLGTELMGNASLLITRAALSRNRLNMGSWYGFNEILYKNALRPREFRFGLNLENDADLSILFSEEDSNRAPSLISGLRLSRNPSRGAIFFESTPSGRFLSKTILSPFPFDSGQHLVDLRFDEGRVKVSVDGKEVASREANTWRTRLLGWRAGAGNSYIDSVSIEDASGNLFADTFRNTKHWRPILLLHVVIFLLLWGGSSLIPSFDVVGPLLAVTTIGLLGFGFDYAYWSGVQVDHLSRPLNLQQPLTDNQLRQFERLRYRFFARWHGLLTSVPIVTPQDLLSQGYPRINRKGPLYCSPKPECGEALSPFSNRKHAYRILLVGTSQAYGAGADRLEETFFVSIHRRLVRHFGERLAIESLNMSVPGSIAPDLLADYKDKFLAFNPDLVLISLGTNDTPDSLRSGLTGFLTLNQSKGIKTVLLKEANFHARNPTHLLKLGIIQELGNKFSVPVWDLDRFLNDAQAADSGFLRWDYAHLTSYGQDLTAQWLAPQVVALIDESPQKTATAPGLSRRVKPETH